MFHIRVGCESLVYTGACACACVRVRGCGCVGARWWVCKACVRALATRLPPAHCLVAADCPNKPTRCHHHHYRRRRHRHHRHHAGDFNTVPERHLAGASIPRLRPGLLICEATYPNRIQGDRRPRERYILDLVCACARAVCVCGWCGHVCVRARARADVAVMQCEAAATACHCLPLPATACHCLPLPATACRPLPLSVSRACVQVHACVTSGGKVLVPVSAVGRAQELLMLMHEHWQRTQLDVSRGPGTRGAVRLLAAPCVPACVLSARRARRRATHPATATRQCPHARHCVRAHMRARAHTHTHIHTHHTTCRCPSTSAASWLRAPTPTSGCCRTGPVSA
jgi:hypothetical protein